MKKRLLILAISAIWAGTVSATTILPGAETSLQSILNSSVSGSSINVNTAQVVNDSYWTADLNPGAYLLIEIAGYAPNNRFGIYKRGSPGTKVEVFSGGAGNGAGSVSIVVPAAWSSFGFYLQNTVNDNFIWYSDASLNAGGGLDHFVAYQGAAGRTVNTLTFDGNVSTNNYAVFGSNDYILAIEDLNLGDKDYNDMVVLVQNVNPVPDGGTTIALAGLGLCSLALLRRKTAAGK